MAKKELGEIRDLRRIKEIMEGNGVATLLVKELSPNDNSKNQVYLGLGFEALNSIPNNGVYVDEERKGSKRDRFKANVYLHWTDLTGNLYPAPHAQLILYPKYPEVRMSGFLKGCSLAPSKLMGSRLKGRLLFLGICNDRRIIGHATGPENPLTNELGNLSDFEKEGIFYRIPLEEIDARQKLIASLKDIHLAGWIDSTRLCADGTHVSCNSPNCGGYTLEAKLGITPNSFAKPDYLGWEIKQHGVTSFDRPRSGSPITLMTPEPTAGIYRDKGVEFFIRKFGYPDQMGREDRINFGGTFKYGVESPSTGLTLDLKGFDTQTGKIVDVDGGITLLSRKGEEAATWLFANMMNHWNRKHAQAAYIPSLCRMEPCRQYCYGNLVELGTGTDFLKFLKSMAKGLVYYDPGIKMENASGPNPRIKRRNQFRIKPADLECLYGNMKTVDLLAE